MCPVVPAFPVELSVAPPAPRSAVLPRPWSLMPEQRPPLPVAPLSKLRHRRWPEAVLPAAVPRVVPEQQAEVPPVAALVRVVPERAALVPVQTRLLSVAVPRQPVLRVAEPQPAPVPQAVLRQVPVAVLRQVPVVVPRSVGVRPWVAALPSVAVPRSVGVRPSVAVPRSRAARPPELLWWTQPVCLRERHWWMPRWWVR